MKPSNADWHLAAVILGFKNYNAARADGHVRPALRLLAARLAEHRCGHEQEAALAPFLAMARNIAAHAEAYKGRIASSGGLSNAADLYPRDFVRLAKVFEA